MPRRGALLSLWAGTFASWHFATAADSETCPANGGPGCSSENIFTEDDKKCVKWRQTGGCTPTGNREPDGDRKCSQEIQPGASGYCECGASGKRRKARLSTCDHRPFTCKDACQQLERYQCVSWRQTGGCDSDGPREDKNDMPCDRQIDPGSSGFCECGGGRKVRKPGCEKGEFAEPFTCQDVCQGEADVYEELDLDSSASEKDIQKAFRKLSLKYHPDKTRGKPEMQDRFNAIRQAYDVINEPEMRAVYDSHGYQKVQEARNQKMQKGPSMNGEVQVSLEGLYNGEEIATSIKRKVICRGCSGKNSKACNKCTTKCAKEIELQNVQFGPMVVQQQVEVESKQKCRMTNAALSVGVEPGMADGDTITFKGTGEQKPNHIPGDVVLTIRARKHKVFTRTGANLNVDIDISLKEALLGFERTIMHLDKREIIVNVDSITVPNAIIKIEGEGMPWRGDPTQKGDLYIKCNIVMPKDDELTENHRKWLSDHFPN